jgi:molecular chaperone DnaK
MNDPIVGIDLGTTNSEVAIVRDGQPYVLEAAGDPILPSVVGLSADGKLLVGHAARNQYVLAPERTVRSIKRKMGQDTTVSLGGQKFRPQEISAMILRSLRDRAALLLGQPIRRAVITVPAYFNDAQRQATREAGELAGLEVVRILNEPTAAALAYDPQQTERRHVLVYDLGGGTFDVSIVVSEAGVVEVLASHGDTALGGDDFDQLLLDSVCDRFADQHGVDLRKDRVAKARLLHAVEAAKRRLSDHPYAPLEEEFIAEKQGRALHVAEELSRPDYEAMIQPLIDRTMDCVHKALGDAEIAGRAIDQVVLVGGATRTPMIGRLLAERLGRPAHREVNPDLIVAMGAALQGAIIAGADVGSVLVDITPHSLGIKALEDDGSDFGMPFAHRFVPIIERNSPLPTARSEAFRTVMDGQRVVEIDVYQGEDEDVRRNHRVGRFLVDGLAAVEAGNQIVVQLDLNLDGMLRVSAREKATGLQKQITIDNALARYEREESATARERIDELWSESFGDGYPYDESAPDLETVAVPPAHEGESEPLTVSISGPAVGHRESVQAKALLEKAERLLTTAQPDDRAELERRMGKVRFALDERQWPLLELAANELADAVFYLEDV